MRSSAGSVTNCLDRLKEGEPDASQQLWERYSQRLINLARGKLSKAPRQISDEEDVALSAFASFFRAVERDRFPRLRDRNDLWQILVMLAHRKLYKLFHRKTPPIVSGVDELLLEIISREPTPQDAVEFTDECKRLLDKLENASLRAVAQLKLESYTNEEIAKTLGYTVRTVERKLKTIRKLWAKDNQA